MQVGVDGINITYVPCNLHFYFLLCIVDIFFTLYVYKRGLGWWYDTYMYTIKIRNLSTGNILFLYIRHLLAFGLRLWYNISTFLCSDPSEGEIIGHSFPIQHTSVSEQPSSQFSSHVSSHIPDVIPQPHVMVHYGNSSLHGTSLNMSQHTTPVSSVSIDSLCDYKPLWECTSASPHSTMQSHKPKLSSTDSFRSDHLFCPDDHHTLQRVPPAPSVRRDSVDSIPDEPPPPPPEKMGQTIPYDPMSVDVPKTQFYDNPKAFVGSQQSCRLSTGSDDFYKVPPSSTMFLTHGSEDDDFYKVPPTHYDDTYDVPPTVPPTVPIRRISKRDSGSSSGGSCSGSHQSTYDYPPLRISPERHRSGTSMLEKHVRTNIHEQSTYDVPPTWRKQRDANLSECVPAPPARPSHTMDRLTAVPPVSSNPYQGGASNSKAHPNYQNSLNEGMLDDTYDVPPNRQPSLHSGVLAPPIAPLPPKQKGAHYINITNKPAGHRGDSIFDEHYTPMNNNKYNSSPIVSPRQSSQRQSSQSDSIYQAPPSNRSVNPPPSNNKPPLLKRSTKACTSPRPMDVPETFGNNTGLYVKNLLILLCCLINE